MSLARRRRLNVSFLLLVFASAACLCGVLEAQQQDETPPVASPSQNPFESVPEGGEETAAPGQETSPFEAPAKAEAPPPGEVENVIEAIEFRGSRRVPQGTLRAMIFSKKGDPLDSEALHRDFMALWNTGRFDDITLERERGEYGWIIRFRVVERRVVRSIKYDGVKSVQISEVLDRFKERRVGLTVETQYDPNTVQYAANVLKEFLAERGRQFATIEPQIRQIPPSSLEITFKVDEGPKVKVGKIDIEGNEVFSDRQLIRSMKLLKPIGIPHSLLFEDLFAKSYDSAKLEQDKALMVDHYQQHGYFNAKTLNDNVNLRDTGDGWFKIPLIYPNKPGKRADIQVMFEEGRQYKINQIIFEGVTLFRTPQSLMRPLFGMESGDIFSTKNLREGLENMQKLYGEFGYIDMVPEPDFRMIPGTDQIDLTLSVDEGDQFFVRRIDFAGNMTTRDKVIRRELLLDEGDMFNTRLWEVSILRLNQLGYFEALKEEEAADIRRDTRNKTVDITLNVKERGKNSVSMTGGVSGIAGSFLGFGYATNNFLGLGETLSIDAQIGSRMKSVQFGFTEPYLFDRPIQSGFTVYTTHFDYDQARELSILTGRDLSPIFEAIGTENLMNYTSQGYGFTTFVQYPLKRSFARLSLTYGYDSQDVTTLNDATEELYTYYNYQGITGPNSLNGIRTSRIVPGYSYNTVDHPITPTKGKSIYFSTSFAGLGGNVKMFSPTVDIKYFRKALKPSHVLGFHFLGRTVSGYGGKAPPPFNRFYMGGENDVRGFDIWGIIPAAFIPSSGTVNVFNADGTPRTQKAVAENGTVYYAPVTQTVPIYQTVWPGGDLSAVGNAEYRIPLFGPVTLAFFADAGINKIIFPSQVGINQERVDELNALYPQAGFDKQAIIDSDTQKLRISTGIEFQIMMPMVNAPFRFYWAYNPMILRQYVTKPVVADRSYFPNEYTYAMAAATVGQPLQFYEDRTTFRFTISRTF